MICGWGYSHESNHTTLCGTCFLGLSCDIFYNADKSEKSGDSRELARFKYDHRGVKKNWDLAPTFPSRAVEDAYMKVGARLSGHASKR